MDKRGKRKEKREKKKEQIVSQYKIIKKFSIY